MMLIIVMMAAMPGCSARPQPFEVLMETDIEGVLASATLAENAIVFVHVDWAIMNRDLFVRFANEYRQVHQHSAIRFHYLDCTSMTGDYQPLRDLPGWRELEGKSGASLIHGWGELVWISGGVVVHVERIINYSKPEDLVSKTDSLFGIPNGPQ